MLSLPRNKADSVFLGGFVVLYLIAVIVHLDVMPLDGEEPRRALVSIEMLHSGNFILPKIFGWEYLNKPPVFSWVLCLFMWLTGNSTEWVVRLPSLIFLILWAFVHYQFTKRFFPKNIAVLSALCLLTNFHLFFYALDVGGEIDIFYAFLVYLQIVSIFYFNQQKKWLQLFIWSYVFCAIGFLTKGFSSIAFQGFTLAALFVFNRSTRSIFRWQHLPGILIFCFLVGSYLYAYSFYGSPQRLVVNLLNESFLKSAVGEHSERVWRKLLVYPFSFLQLLLPWSLFLLLLLKKHSYRLKSHPLVQFSILFILFNIWIYALTGRPFMRYVYTFIPFCYNILLFIFWKTNEEYPELINKIFKYAILFFLAALILFVAAPFFVHIDLAMHILFGLVLVGFIILYHYPSVDKVSLFYVGIVLLRLIYAFVFIPIHEKLIRVNYRNVAASMVQANYNTPITYWSQPQPINIGLDLKFSKWKLESVMAPPFIFYQIPYYYYYHSGKLLKYDTVLVSNKTYFAYRSSAKGKNISVLWSWYDVRQKQDFVLFKTK